LVVLVLLLPLFILYFDMKKDLHKTILVIVAGLLLLSFIFDAPLMVAIATTVGVASLVSNHLANAIVWFWEKLAQVLGFINTRILLSVLFYLFLFPIAMLSRLFSKDPMQLKNPKASVFVTRNHTYTSKDLENMW
jgi:hypothetical protein